MVEHSDAPPGSTVRRRARVAALVVAVVGAAAPGGWRPARAQVCVERVEVVCQCPEGACIPGQRLVCETPCGSRGVATCGPDCEIEGCLPPDEACNGVDDDCDGAVDEGLLNACGTCGPVPDDICNGRDDDCDGITDEAAGCDDCPLPDERCNGVDDDCDGDIDEGVLNRCGRCGPVPAEVCNGADDDCDGRVDEDLVNACGACGPVPAEVCNGIDDDCNGEIDEGLLNRCGQCGALPVEVCNGIDDDCNGEIDEGLLNRCGQCGPLPVEVCNDVDDDCDGRLDEAVRNACGRCGPLPDEVCNGIDDDCDGQTDEGRLNVCTHYATCVSQPSCAPCAPPPRDLCNRQDDDCDGAIDEDDPCRVVGSGGGCAAAGAPGGSTLAPRGLALGGLALLLSLLGRRRRRVGVVLISWVGVSTLGSVAARAQSADVAAPDRGFRVRTLDGRPGPGHLLVHSGELLRAPPGRGPWLAGLAAQVDYRRETLLIEGRSGSPHEVLIEGHLTVSPAAMVRYQSDGWVFEGLLAAPFSWLDGGEPEIFAEFEPGDGSGSDGLELYLVGARRVTLGSHSFRVIPSLTLALPLGEGDDYRTDAGPSGRVGVQVDTDGAASGLAGSIGLAYRPAHDFELWTRAPLAAFFGLGWRLNAHGLIALQASVPLRLSPSDGDFAIVLSLSGWVDVIEQASITEPERDRAQRRSRWWALDATAWGDASSDPLQGVGNGWVEGRVGARILVGPASSPMPESPCAIIGRNPGMGLIQPPAGRPAEPVRCPEEE